MVVEFETADLDKAVAPLFGILHRRKSFLFTQALAEEMNLPGNTSFNWHVTRSAPRWSVTLDNIKEQEGHTTPWSKILREEYADVTALTRWLLARADSRPAAEFASILEDIREVHSVRTLIANGTTHMWTYLDAKPFDKPLRYEVLDAEEKIFDRYPGERFDFHLVNLSEYPDEVRDDVTLMGEAIYQRQEDGEQNPASISSS